MTDNNKLSEFTMGYVVALSTLVNNDGVSGTALEMYGEIGEPTIKQLKAMDLNEFDLSNIKKIVKDLKQ